MEIDTGASVSIASRETFKTIQQGEETLELQESAAKLQGEPIRVCGSTVVQVEHDGQSVPLPLIITEGRGPTLLGRNCLEPLRLNWRTIFKIGRNLSLEQVLTQHVNVFKGELGELRGVKAKIHINENARPYFGKSRQVPFAIREKVERELERLLALGVIQPTITHVRICGDYKVSINRADKYPIPRIEELFASSLSSTSLTRTSRSRWTKPRDSMSPLTPTRDSLSTGGCPSVLLRLPLSSRGSWRTYNRGSLGYVCIYLDDILVTGATEQEHLANLAQVLQRLESAGMKLKRPKCAFMLQSVSYLGHVISAEGLCTAESKVKAIVDAPEPRNASELRSIFGMVNYYGKFLPNLATKLSPLYKLRINC